MPKRETGVVSGKGYFKVRLVKVLIAVVLIGIMEIIPDWKEQQEKYCFEISMSILMAGWIMCDGWL